MRIAYEFKVSPNEVLGWSSGLFDYACVYINERDKKDKERIDEMNRQRGAVSRPQTMKGGRRR